MTPEREALIRDSWAKQKEDVKTKLARSPLLPVMYLYEIQPLTDLTEYQRQARLSPTVSYEIVRLDVRWIWRNGAPANQCDVYCEGVFLETLSIYDRFGMHRFQRPTS